MIKISESTPRTSDCSSRSWRGTSGQRKWRRSPAAVEMSRAFAALPWDLLFFTGGSEVGRKILAATAGNLTPTVLELGGKSPCVLLEDAGCRRGRAQDRAGAPDERGPGVHRRRLRASSRTAPRAVRRRRHRGRRRRVPLYPRQPGVHFRHSRRCLRQARRIHRRGQGRRLQDRRVQPDERGGFRIGPRGRFPSRSSSIRRTISWCPEKRSSVRSCRSTRTGSSTTRSPTSTVGASRFALYVFGRESATDRQDPAFDIERWGHGERPAPSRRFPHHGVRGSGSERHGTLQGRAHRVQGVLESQVRLRAGGS